MKYTLEKNENGEITLTLVKKFKTTEEAMTALMGIEKVSDEDSLSKLEIEKANGKYSLNKLEIELFSIMRTGSFIMAVKHYKDVTGQGLKESKDFCDELKLKFIRLGLIENK